MNRRVPDIGELHAVAGRMGGAKRYPSLVARQEAMGFARAQPIRGAALTYPTSNLLIPATLAESVCARGMHQLRLTGQLRNVPPIERQSFR